MRSTLQPCTQEDEESMDLGGRGNILCHKIITKADFIAKSKSGWLLPQMTRHALRIWTVPTGSVTVPSALYRDGSKVKDSCS